MTTSAITPGHHRSPALHPCRGGHWPSARRGFGPAPSRANSHNLTRYGFASACFFTWLLPRTSDAEQSGGLFCILFPSCGGSAAGTGIHSHRPYTRIRIRPVSLHTDSHPARLCPMRRQPRFMAEGRFIWPKAMLHRPRAQPCGRFIFATTGAHLARGSVAVIGAGWWRRSGCGPVRCGRSACAGCPASRLRQAWGPACA